MIVANFLISLVVFCSFKKSTGKQSIQEDNLTRRQEEGLTERRNHRNLTSLEAEYYLTKRQEEVPTGR